MTAEASSPDGRSFRFTGARGAFVEPGAFVTLSGDGFAADDVQFGQIDAVSHTSHGAEGWGRLLGALTGDGSFDATGPHAFEAGDMAAADSRAIDALQRASRATLTIGSHPASTAGAADATPARLLAQRFNRHTFWVGQSGSGKTYALGVVLEQLLLHTALPVVVDRKSTRLNSSHQGLSRMPSSA